MTKRLINSLVEAGQDFEFYPTTEEIIAALVADLTRSEELGGRHWRLDQYSSVLDIGAGHGKVLLALRERAKMRDLHAIEKSQLLCEQLDPGILIVGTDFWEQSLLSKHVDVVFSNPPYSEFAEWAVRIIRQSASKVVYLVLPLRWVSSAEIKAALRYRETDAEIVGEFDFLDAEDRTARAKVHLLRIKLRDGRRRDDADDAFERFFKETFADLIGRFDSKLPPRAAKEARFKELVVGPSYLQALVAMYDQDILKIQRNYEAVSTLDVELLREFNVSPDSIMAGLKTRLAGLRTEYWHELFDHLDKVTDRLTSGSRQKLLDVLHKHVHVDFTLSNIYAVCIWVVKNANLYIDSQLISVYELMVDKANVLFYASNQRTWVEDNWRYSRTDHLAANSHYALDYRIVTHRIGGCRAGEYSHDRGLDERAANFLGDLLTLASNLGFRGTTMPHVLTRSGRERWTPGKLYEFHGTDRRGRPCVLFDVRAFKNGNLHLRFHSALMLALNVEHGRLKGWLRSRDEAVEELQDPEAGELFFSNTRLTPSSLQLLPAPDEREAA